MKEITGETIAEMAGVFDAAETEMCKGNMSKIARMESHLDSMGDILERMMSLNTSQTALMRVLVFYAANSMDPDKRDIVRTLIDKNSVSEFLGHIESSHGEIAILQGVLEHLKS